MRRTAGRLGDDPASRELDGLLEEQIDSMGLHSTRMRKAQRHRVLFMQYCISSEAVKPNVHTCCVSDREFCPMNLNESQYRRRLFACLSHCVKCRDGAEEECLPQVSLI